MEVRRETEGQRFLKEKDWIRNKTGNSKEEFRKTIMAAAEKATEGGQDGIYRKGA